MKVKATPTLHPNHEVTLQLEFEIRALAGTSINGIPVISNRTLTQTVRVKDDETTIIGGLLVSQALTLYTTPVVYLYLDRLQVWLRGGRKTAAERREEIHAVAAE